MATTAFDLRSQQPLPLRAGRIALAALLLLLASLSMLVMGATALFVPVLALFVAAAIAVAVLAWPVQAVFVTLVIIPLSRFISLLVFAATGSSMALRASQLIKDEILLVLLLAVANLAFRNRTAPRLRYLDLLIAVYVAVALLYVAYPGPDGAGNASLIGKVLALRQDVLWLLAYFVGRGIPLTRNSLRRMVLTLVTLSVLLGLVAGFQWAFPAFSNRAFAHLDFDRFMETLGAGHEDLAVRSRGIAGADLPRSSSLFLSDMGLAFYQVLIIPFAAALFFYARSRGAVIGYGAFLLLMLAALGMTITRTAIAVSVLGLGLVLFRTSSYARAATVVGVAAVVSLAVVAFRGFDAMTLSALTSTREGSALGHFALFEKAVSLIRANPLGLGLGNGSHVANALGGFSVGAVESWYLQISLEMGVIATVFFFAIVATSTIGATLDTFRVRDPLLRVLTVSVAGAGLSLMVLSAFHPVWAAVHVTYLYWLLSGIAGRALALEKEWSGSEEGWSP